MKYPWCQALAMNRFFQPPGLVRCMHSPAARVDLLPDFTNWESRPAASDCMSCLTAWLAHPSQSSSVCPEAVVWYPFPRIQCERGNMSHCFELTEMALWHSLCTFFCYVWSCQELFLLFDVVVICRLGRRLESHVVSRLSDTGTVHYIAALAPEPSSCSFCGDLER